MRILFTGVIFSDYLIPKVISDYLSIAFREKLMITVAKPQALVSFKKYMRKGHIFFEWNKCLWAKHIIILVIIRSLATPYAGPHKLFRSFLKLPCCIFTVAERKQSKAVISFEEWNWKSCSAALQWGSPIPFPKGGACVLSVIRFQDGGRRSAVVSAEARIWSTTTGTCFW